MQSIATRRSSRLALAIYILAAAAVVYALLPRSAGAQTLIERVSISDREDGQGYVVRFHTDGRVPAFTLQPTTDEVELVLFRSSLASSFSNEPARGSIRDYTVRQDRDRVIVRFSLDPAYFSTPTAYHDRESHDLLFAVTHDGDRRLAEAVSQARPASRVEQAPPASAGPAGESYLASYIEQGKRWKLDTIVIDAGHGGHDFGAVANGVREKDINLAIALKLGGYIEENLGLNVVYTRKTDRFVDLQERGRIANRAGGKLFISIHANSTEGARARVAEGTETWFLGMHRTDYARKVMERENSVIRLEDNPEVYARYTDENLIYQSLALSSYMRESERLAGLIESQFKNRAARTSRGVKQAGFIVLWAASMPAVLVETGFITNPREAAFLASERGQTLIASAVFRAVRDYKEQYEKGLDLASTRQSESP